MATDSSYMVLLAFTAGDATQLSIAPGDRVQLITADSGTGWSFGRSLASNAQGWFPASYVQKQQAHKPALRPLSCLPGSSLGSLPVTPPLPQSPLPAAVTRPPPSVASSPLPPSLAPLPPPIAASASPAKAPLPTPLPASPLPSSLTSLSSPLIHTSAAAAASSPSPSPSPPLPFPPLPLSRRPISPADLRNRSSTMATPSRLVISTAHSSPLLDLPLAPRGPLAPPPSLPSFVNPLSPISAIAPELSSTPNPSTSTSSSPSASSSTEKRHKVGGVIATDAEELFAPGPLIHSVSMAEFHLTKGNSMAATYPADVVHRNQEELANLCFPEGAHLHTHDWVFIFLWDDGPLFGLAFYSRFEDASLTRGALQKSLLVLARKPYFHMFQKVLNFALQWHFAKFMMKLPEGENQLVLKTIYDAFNSSAVGSDGLLRFSAFNSSFQFCFLPIHYDTYFPGASLLDLVKLLRDKVLLLWKSLLLRQRILFSGAQSPANLVGNCCIA
ncbi:MAG: DENN domain-containing protein, partial [archaeon]|nr:DENN domain-containing protein [archaeon]